MPNAIFLEKPQYPFLQGGGEMGELTRNFDWSQTEIGSPDQWPESLRVTLSIMLSSRFPMFLWWAENMIQFYNDGYRPSLGNEGKHPKALGQRGKECWPEIWEIIYPLIRQVQTTGIATWSEDQLVPIYRNGRIEDVYWTFSYSPVWGESGEVGGVLVVCTETTRAVLSGSRLQLAIDTTGLGTWDYVPQTETLYLSPEFRLILGIGHEKPVSFDTFMGNVHPEDKELILQQLTLPRSKVSDRYDLKYRIYRFDNNDLRWVNVRGIVLFDGSGKPNRLTGTILDITEARQAEERSAKLAAIVTYSDDAIISKTLDSIVTSWNHSAERIFGYSEAEMIGQSILKIIPADRADEELHIIERLSLGEPVDHFETKRLTKDGRVLDVSLTISPLRDNEGNIIGASKIARDISEQKRNEQRKNDFIGMVSHELKTPLTSLNAVLQFAAAKLKNSQDSFLRTAMSRANLQVKKMTSLINGFLNVSRLESGQMYLDKRWFDLDSLLRDIVEESTLIAPSNPILFEDCEKTPVYADYDKISSVISNLIGNAVKYSGNGKPINVYCRIDGKMATVSVADNGAGIKPEDLKRIFERYYRVENDLSHHVAGFGIGLYLSSEIVKGHRGKIWAESKPGKGSAFHFTLPLGQTE